MSRSFTPDDIEEDDDERAYCPKCSKVGVHAVMGERIYDEGVPIPDDHVYWLQCHTCGFLLHLGLHETDEQRDRINEKYR
jgi:uncharacterized Zn finger protein